MKKWMKYGAAAVMAAGMVLGGSMEALAAHLEDITARGTIRGTTLLCLSDNLGGTAADSVVPCLF